MWEDDRTHVRAGRRRVAFRAEALVLGVCLFVSMPYLALAGEGRHLWLESGVPEQQTAGSVAVEIRIRYGVFPHEGEPLAELVGVQAFYELSTPPEYRAGGWRQSPVARGEQVATFTIRAEDTTRVRVVVHARGAGRAAEPCLYSASAAFLLFGHTLAPHRAEEAVLRPEPDIPLKILLEPEFNYWPQTGDAYRIGAAFRRVLLPGQVVCLLDQNAPKAQLRTGGDGYVVYAPPHDTTLNRQSETAFKHTLVLVEHTADGARYVSTQALLLHRSRYGNRNLSAGLGVLALAMLASIVVAGLVGGRNRRIWR